MKFILSFLIIFIRVINSCAMYQVEGNAFFSEIRKGKPDNIKRVFFYFFEKQSKELPLRWKNRQGEQEVGDIIQPKEPYIIDFEQSIKNSARHMIESGHFGWFEEEKHTSAKAWTSFFIGEMVPKELTVAENFVRILIKETVEKCPLYFCGEVYSGKQELIGCDFITDIPSNLTGVVFMNGHGKFAPGRDGFKPKNIGILKHQNDEIVNLLKQGGKLGKYENVKPIFTNKMILRVAFRKDPLYRYSEGKLFLKYRGYVIDFLSLYPQIPNN